MIAVAQRLHARIPRAALAHYGFLIGMGFKALDGALELLGGLGLLTVTVPQIERWVWHITSSDLGEDTRGHVARLAAPRRGAPVG